MLWFALLLTAPQEDIDCFAAFGNGASGEAKLAKVIADRASFTSEAITAKSGTRPYVVRGDDVVIGTARNGYVPAEYLDGTGSGCLPAASLQVISSPPPSPSDWAGEWSGPGDATISLKIQGNRIVATGTATWSGGPMTINDGSIEGVGTPRGTVLDIAGECPSHLQLLGNHLIVTDLGACDGVNVSFSGIYSR